MKMISKFALKLYVFRPPGDGYVALQKRPNLLSPNCVSVFSLFPILWVNIASLLFIIFIFVQQSKQYYKHTLRDIIKDHSSILLHLAPSWTFIFAENLAASSSQDGDGSTMQRGGWIKTSRSLFARNFFIFDSIELKFLYCGSIWLRIGPINQWITFSVMKYTFFFYKNQ